MQEDAMGKCSKIAKIKRRSPQKRTLIRARNKHAWVKAMKLDIELDPFFRRIYEKHI